MKKLIFLILLVSLCFTLPAQNTYDNLNDTLTEKSLLGPVIDTIPDINIFGDEEPLKIKLTYDITSFIKNKNKGEYLDAILQINYSDTQTITKNIRVKARGNFRRGQCKFPPIFLNFKTDPMENNELEGIKKIKLVTHCSSAKSDENYILKEYLAYKIYNILTEKSFRVRLLDITYIDTGKKGNNYHNYGFLIEPEELVAERNKSIEIDPVLMREQNVVEEDADRVALFQYMIGNTDWRIKGGHNMKCLKSLTQITDKVIPLPYDFDFSGFVGTNYSFPQSWTSIKEVTEREYMGYCRDDEQEYLDNINYFLNDKDKIFELIDNFKMLDEREKKSLSKFIQDFYYEISSPEKFVQTLESQCRTNF